MRQVPFWHFKVILLSFCCVLEGDIAYQSLLYHCHLFFLFCFVFFTFWSFSFSFGSFCVKHLFISHNLNIILGKKVSLLVIFFSNRSRYFQVCASFQALCIIFVIQLITQVMTQTFWQGGSVQGRIVSLSAALFSCHVSTGPLSLSHNISAQRRHPAPRWVAITGNTATLVSECVLLYLRALGAASLENELWRGWEGWLGPRWSRADRQVIYSPHCTHTTGLLQTDKL